MKEYCIIPPKKQKRITSRKKKEGVCNPRKFVGFPRVFWGGLMDFVENLLESRMAIARENMRSEVSRLRDSFSRKRALPKENFCEFSISKNIELNWGNSQRKNSNFIGIELGLPDTNPPIRAFHPSSFFRKKIRIVSVTL